jgi:PKD repeat protein
MVQDYYPLTVPFGSNLPLAFPTANFTYTPIEPLADQVVVFNASTSTCVKGTIIHYNWDFGDGETGTGQTVSHVYSADGNYNVSLTAISSTFIPYTKNQAIYVARAWAFWTIVAAAASVTVVIAIALVVLVVRRSKRKKRTRKN